MPQRLNALLSSADVVVCTIDNVSHDAYKQTFQAVCEALRVAALVWGVDLRARWNRSPPEAGMHTLDQPSRPPEAVPPVVILENPS